MLHIESNPKRHDHLGHNYLRVHGGMSALSSHVCATSGIRTCPAPSSQLCLLDALRARESPTHRSIDILSLDDRVHVHVGIQPRHVDVPGGRDGHIVGL